MDSNSSTKTLLEIFDTDVSKKLCKSPVESFWQCRSDFELLLNSDAIVNELNDAIRPQIDNPSYISQKAHINNFFLLDSQYYDLSISWYLENQTSTFQNGNYISSPTGLCTMGKHGMIAAIGKKSVVCDLYEMPEVNIEIFESGLKLKKIDTLELKPGQVLEVNGLKHVLGIHETFGQCLLRFYSAPVSSIIWSFDKETLKSWGASATVLKQTQIKVLMNILKRLNYQESATNILQYCEHESHEVRWEAIITLGILAPEMAMQQLEKAILDVHPHVSSAAKKALQEINSNI